MTLDASVSNKITSDQLIARKLLTISLAAQGVDDICVLENETFEKLVIGTKTYLAAPLEVSDVTKNEGFQSVQIALSNVGGALSALIRQHGDILTGATCLLEEAFLEDDATIVSGSAFPLFVGQANNLVITQQKLSFDIEAVLGAYVAISPNMTYGVNCQWRRFRDVNCAYAGGAATCDKTLTSCAALGNLANFGGFPSLPAQEVIKA